MCLFQLDGKAWISVLDSLSEGAQWAEGGRREISLG